MLGNKKEKKKHVLHFLVSQAMPSFMFHFMSYIVQRMDEEKQYKISSEHKINYNSRFSMKTVEN